MLKSFLNSNPNVIISCFVAFEQYLGHRRKLTMALNNNYWFFVVLCHPSTRHKIWNRDGPSEVHKVRDLVKTSCEINSSKVIWMKDGIVTHSLLGFVTTWSSSLIHWTRQL